MGINAALAKRFEWVSVLQSRIKNAPRRARWFAQLGHTQPTEMFISLVMIHSGVVLWYAHGGDILPYPMFFAAVLSFLGVVGLLGTLLSFVPLRLTFAFFGVFVRLWMCSLYIVRDVRDPAWVSLAFSAAALTWVLIRVACDTTKKGALRRRARMQRLEPVRRDE